MAKEISQEEFLEWRSHPVTLALMEATRQRVEDFKQRWSKGEFFSAEGTFASQVLQAKAIGTCQSLEWFLNLEPEDINP